MSSKLYFAVVDRNGWKEFHVSRDKADVLSLTAMSRKIPLHSNLLEKFKEEVAYEMKQYGSIDVTAEVRP